MEIESVGPVTVEIFAQGVHLLVGKTDTFIVNAFYSRLTFQIFLGSFHTDIE